MRVSSITKNAGKACNNRLYRHIRTFEKIIKNYFVIFMKYLKNVVKFLFLKFYFQKFLPLRPYLLFSQSAKIKPAGGQAGFMNLPSYFLFCRKGFRIDLRSVRIQISHYDHGVFHLDRFLHIIRKFLEGIPFRLHSFFQNILCCFHLQHL